MKLDVYSLIIGIIIGAAILTPFAVYGFKLIKKRRQEKKLLKEGYVKVAVLDEGVVQYFVVKPNSKTVTLFGSEEYVLTPSAKRIEAETGFPIWFFKKGESIPLTTENDDFLLDANMLYKVIMEEAAAHSGQELLKYLKLILIAIIGLFGTMFFFMSGGG